MMNHNALFEKIKEEFADLVCMDTDKDAGTLTEQTERFIEIYKSLYVDNSMQGTGLWKGLCDIYGENLRKCSELARKQLMRNVEDYINKHCKQTTAKPKEPFDIIEALTRSAEDYKTPKYHGCINFTPDLGVFYTIPFDFPPIITYSKKGKKTPYPSIYKPVLYNPRKGFAHEIDEEKESEIQKHLNPQPSDINAIVAQHAERVEGVQTYISAEQRGQMVEEYLALIKNGGIACKDFSEDLVRTLVTRHIYYFKYNNEIENYIVSCWIIGTYLFPMFSVYPYLLFIGEKGTNKSGALTFLSRVCWNPTTKLSLPNEVHMFRLATQAQPTLIIDEIHRQLNDPIRGPTLKALLEAGHEKGGSVPRCADNDSDKIVFHEVYTPKALASREALELEEKAITIIPRKVMDSKYAIARKDLDTDPKLPEIQKELLRYALATWEEIHTEYNNIKPTPRVAGRYFMLWAPILSICKVAYPDKYDEMVKYSEIAISSINDSSVEVETQLLNWLAVNKAEIRENGNSVLLKHITRGIEELTWQSVAHALRNLGLIKNQRTTNEGKRYYLRMDKLNTLIEERSIRVEKPETAERATCELCGNVRLLEYEGLNEGRKCLICAECAKDPKEDTEPEQPQTPPTKPEEEATVADGGGGDGILDIQGSEEFKCICGAAFSNHEKLIKHKSNCDIFQKSSMKKAVGEARAVKRANSPVVFGEITKEEEWERTFLEKTYDVTLKIKPGVYDCEQCKTRETHIYFSPGLKHPSMCLPCFKRYFENAARVIR